MQAIKVLVLLALAAHQCVAIPTTVTVNDCPAAVPACAKVNANIIVPEAIETLQVDTTAAKFTKMNPAAFISAMTSSGGSETDCRDFATETQTEISTSVTSTQATLDAIDNGDGCAQEGQTEVSTAQDRVDNAQTSLTAAQANVVTKEAAKHVACTADVNLGTMSLEALEMETCFDYTSLADYTTIKAACTSATSALTAANQAVVTAQAELTDAQTAHAAAVTEAARLMSACLCRVHHEQNAAWSAATSATASHAADWKQAHEVVCALDQTTTCTVPTCPTVTQPTVAAGVANADAEHCTSTPTTAPTTAPTTGAPTVAANQYVVTGAALNSNPASSLGVTWIVGPRSLGSTCNAVCNAVSPGSSCVREGIRLVTLQSNCAFQMAATGSSGCGACSPSDSTNAYCFPGQSLGGNSYYHASWGTASFTCDTAFDGQQQILCPCSR
jgi:hypothetical protein